jgi:hypothetical protein
MELELKTSKTVAGTNSRKARCDDDGRLEVIVISETGDATASKEATQLSVKTAVEALQTATGAVTASPTANTLLARLKDLLTGIILAAGTNLIGKVGIDQTTPGTTDSVTVKSGTVPVTVSTTRPNDTNAYAVGDVIGTATGSTAAVKLTAIGPAGKVIRITGTRHRIDVTQVPTITAGTWGFRLHLYSATPPSAFGDNAAWDLTEADRPYYLGFVDLGAPIDNGSTLYIQQTGLDGDFPLTTADLWCYHVTNAAYQPTASAVKTTTLFAMAM